MEAEWEEGQEKPSQRTFPTLTLFSGDLPNPTILTVVPKHSHLCSMKEPVFREGIHSGSVLVRGTEKINSIQVTEIVWPSPPGPKPLDKLELDEIK